MLALKLPAVKSIGRQTHVLERDEKTTLELMPPHTNFGHPGVTEFEVLQRAILNARRILHLLKQEGKIKLSDEIIDTADITSCTLQTEPLLQGGIVSFSIKMSAVGDNQWQRYGVILRAAKTV